MSNQPTVHASPAGHASPAATLPEEHALLRAEVSSRAGNVLETASRGAWPAHELHRLLDYLYVELLQQAGNEEWLLFRAMHDRPDLVSPLLAEHRVLRAAVDAIAAFAAAPEACGPEELTGLITDLLAVIEKHFAAEQSALRGEHETPSTASLGGTPHEWYAAVDQPVIDLADLPGEHGADTVLGRLLRMQPGETIELRSPTDPRPLWRRLAAADPDGYGYHYLQEGELWRIEITRRAGR